MKLINALIGLTIFAIIAGILLPIGLPYLTGFNSTDSNVQTLVRTLAVMIPLGLLLGVVRASITKPAESGGI